MIPHRLGGNGAYNDLEIEPRSEHAVEIFTGPLPATRQHQLGSHKLRPPLLRDRLLIEIVGPFSINPSNPAFRLGK